ncbi:MAG: tetratricopeptide repeat protein [Elusimicrobiota bacterium]
MLRSNRIARACWLALTIAGLALPARSESFPSCSAKAEKAQRRGDPAAALQHWSDALRLWNPTYGKKAKAAALSGRARAHEQKGRFGSAVRDLSEAISLDPKNASLFHLRGRAHREQGEITAAISDLYQATTLRPSLGEAFHERARAYLQDGDPKFAHEDYRTACRLGFKPACSEAKKKPEDLAPARPALAAAARTPPAPEPAPEPEPEPAPAPAPAEAAPRSDDSRALSYVTIRRHHPAERHEAAAFDPAAVDFNACLSRMRACVSNGDSFGSCVARSRRCEREPKQGCCPSACSALFSNLANSKSEAQAFREVFRPRSPCAPR